MRKHLQLFANFRPAICYPELTGASSLKPELVAGLDILIVRELNGDIYFGQPRGVQRGAGRPVQGRPRSFRHDALQRAGKSAASRMWQFQAAAKRGKKLCSVDKANVLENLPVLGRT
ncbi:isocitrate/isopropylmalate family dehydrogenase [Cupriavidus basilensis]